ncbi:MAG TPA: PAS domain-containing sensor histidine kinase, partial [Candidatus Thermoplasmatota archaeon]|nr:PAS domain-containing sensor histidine kinase [Candidatus Thermoplasmatota archaeon]
AALALVTSSAIFTQFWGGYIEGHFHFFIVVAVVTMYQDYVPFLLAIAYVAIDHGIIGTLAPTWVYNHPDALAHPWTWATYHALLVLGESVVLLYVWRMSEKTRSQVDLLMNAAGEGILGLDTRGRVAFANPAAATLTGRGMDALLGQPFEEILRDAKNPEAVLVMTQTEGYESGDNLVVLRPGGKTIPVQWARSPVREHGQTIGTVMTLVDATPQKQAEEERRKRLEQFNELERLKELDSFKTLFINTAAHELHTPLTPLRLNVYALKEGHKGVLNDGQKQVVDVLERNVERLSLLVEEVLNAARLQANKFTITKKPVNLNSLVNETVASFGESAQEAGVSLVYEGAGPCYVLGDERRLGQVLYNLIDNSLKFSKQGGQITINLGKKDGGVLLRVADRGAGIAAADIVKLFQPFSQVHDHMAYTRSGSGLGLYICKGILELHGGRIWGESPGPGKGSTFSLILPVAETNGTDTTAATVPRPPTPFGPSARVAVGSKA